MTQQAGRQSWYFIGAYVSFAFILTWTYYAVHLGTLDSWRQWHEALLSGAIHDANQYRILAYWLPELLHRFLHTPIIESYLAVRFFCTLATLSLFHIFLLKWFTTERTFLATTLFAAVVPATYLLYLQEADIVVLPLFLLAFWFIRDRRFWPLCLVVIAGVFAKETILFTIPLWCITRWRDGWKRSAIESLVLSGAWWAAYALLTHALFFYGKSLPLWQFPHNVETLTQLVRLYPLSNFAWLQFALFGPFWLLAFVGRKRLNGFLRFVPEYAVLFVALNFMFGWPEEARLLLPLGFLLIPAGLIVLFPELQQSPDRAD